MSAPIALGVPLAEALADELVLASRMLAELAWDLGQDEVILRRHMTGLQKIDHVTQMQLAIADLLRNGDGERDWAAIPLDDMAQRLRRATRAGPAA